MTPAISVIVPVYNVELYIEDAIKSVLDQTMTDFEVVIVDDGSMDGSIGIVNRLAEGDVRFRYVRQQNSGLGAARMTGLRHAKGEYVTFLDSDDRLRPDALEALYRAVEQHDADIVSGRFERISEAGVPDEVVTHKLVQHEIPESAGSLKPWQEVLGVFSPSIACARLYSKRLLQGINPLFPPRLPHEDLFFTYKALLRSKRHHAIDDIVYQYRQRDGSLSKGVSKAHVEAFFEQIDDTNRFFRDDPEMYPLAAPLAARRSLIMLHGVRTRVKNADHDVRGYFSKKIERRYPELIRQLGVFQKSYVKDAFIPPQSVKYLEDVERNMKDRLEKQNAAKKAPAPSILQTYKQRESVPISGDDRAALRNLHDRFRGKRAFIVGNGPALNKHDLSLLDGEYVFGVNSIFLKSRESDFRPTFYVVEDSKVYEENAEDIASYDVPFKFFPADYREKYGAVPGALYFQMNQGFYLTNSPNHGVPRFSTDFSRELFCGQTVTYLNMQIAFYLGFERVYLIGMDFDYQIPDSHVRKGNHIISTTDDPNHFHKDYFGVGKTWKDPKLDRVAMNYRQAKLSYEAVGRKIFNATIGGKLEIFDRVDYETLLRDPATGRKLREKPPVVITRTVEAGEGQAASAPASPAANALPATPPPQKQMSATAPQPATPQGNAAPASAAPVAETAHAETDPPQKVRRAFYAPLGNAVRTHAPTLFPLLQRLRRIIWKLVKSPAVWIAAIGGLGAIALALRGPWPLEQRLLFAGAAIGAGALAGLGLMAWRLRRYVAHLSAQNRELFGKIEHMQDLTKGRDAWANQISDNQSKLRGELSQHHARLRGELSKNDAKLRGEVERLRSESSKTNAAVRQGLNAEISNLESRLQRLVSDQSRTNDHKVRSEVAMAVSRLKADLGAWEARQKTLAAEGEKELELQLDELHQRINATLEEQLRQQDRIDALKSDADSQVQAALKDFTDRLAGVENKVDSGAEALADAKQELEDSLKALRQGLEQRMHAEIDEYAQKSTAELIGRVDAIETALEEGKEVREIAESNAALTKEIHKAVKIARVERARLLERAQASERQIGALRYPDAPDVFVFFGHHKCASRFFRMEVFERIAESTGARTRKYEITDPPFHYSKMDELDLVNVDFKGLGKDGRDVVLFANASQRGLNKIKRNAKDWKGLRIIRDPRQVLISNYFHHKGDHPDVSPLGWTWDQLVEDKPILNELPKEEGILHELDNISKQVIEDQILAPFDDERVMTIRLEDFSKDPAEYLQRISEFMKVPDVAGINFDNKQANPDSGPWKKHFTSKIRERFKERYGQALIDLGYAEDMDW